MSLDDLGAAFKAARQAKHLTQHALGKKVGLPQSHISKIESGAIDMQILTAIELARVLDMELFLVPRRMVTLVRDLQRGLDRPQRRPAYALDDEDENAPPARRPMHSLGNQDGED